MSTPNGTEVARVEQPTAAALAGWEQSGAGEIEVREAGALAVAVREDTELKAAIVAAKRFPRDEAASYTRIINACRRPGFAEKARYSFPRGGSQVSGPSVNLAREAARAWGNIRHGLRIVTVDDEQVHIRGYALDLETNTYAEAEDRFAKLIQRKRNGRTQWVEPDERDLRELVNRRGAICVRNAILQVLPADVIEDALRQSEETLRKAAAGELKQDRAGAIRRLALAFDELGVSTAAIEEYLGHPLDAITEAEIADLRGVYRSIVDGHTKREEHFNIGSARTHEKKAEIEERIRQIEQEQAPADPPLPDAPGNDPIRAEDEAPAPWDRVLRRERVDDSAGDLTALAAATERPARAPSAIREGR